MFQQLKFGAFVVRPEYNRSHPRHRPHRPPCGKGAPSKIEKNRNFQNLNEFDRRWGKKFQGLSPRVGICCRATHCLITEQNRAGLHGTVSPPDGAERVPIEKFAPPPRPNLGADPNFNILFYGDPHPLQTLKTSRENLDPFLRNFFSSKNWRKFKFFGVRGTPQYQRIQKKIQASSSLWVVQIWLHYDFGLIPFFAKNRFPHCRQWKGRLITCPLSAGKTLTTEWVDVGAIYS